MLTAEQLELRKTGIGASEVSALTGSSPYAQPIDVWLAKTGRADGLVENEAMRLGNELEGALTVLYSGRTGRMVERRATTHRHPDFSHVLATPDALVDGGERGLEIKLVGARMAHHWAEESVPDYVQDQARQNMAVLGIDSWDVLALIGSTECRITTIHRDYEHEAVLLEACETFWALHVDTDTAPEIEDPERRRAYLLQRYPGSEMTKATDVTDAADADEIEQAIRWRRTADEMIEALKGARDQLTNIITERIGADYGIQGPWGKFLHYPVKGRVNWEAVARALSPAIPADLIEQHRGESSRVPRYYPPSVGKTKGKR